MRPPQTEDTLCLAMHSSLRVRCVSLRKESKKPEADLCRVPPRGSALKSRHQPWASPQPGGSTALRPALSGERRKHVVPFLFEEEVNLYWRAKTTRVNLPGGRQTNNYF